MRYLYSPEIAIPHNSRHRYLARRNLSRDWRSHLEIIKVPKYHFRPIAYIYPNRLVFDRHTVFEKTDLDFRILNCYPI